jgi:putative redox protein
VSGEIKRAQVKWVERMKFVGTGNSGKSIIMDAPVVSGGEGSAITPGELVLVALGGCTSVDVIGMLNKMRVPFRDLKIEIEAETVEEYPKIYRWVKMIYRICGCKDENKARKAVALSKEKYCSVSAILARSAEVKYDIVFEP